MSETSSAERDALSLLLRRSAREHLGLKDGDYWPSDVADAQARAVLAAGYVTPPAKTTLAQPTPAGASEEES